MDSTAVFMQNYDYMIYSHCRSVFFVKAASYSDLFVWMYLKKTDDLGKSTSTCPFLTSIEMVFGKQVCLLDDQGISICFFHSLDNVDNQDTSKIANYGESLSGLGVGIRNFGYYSSCTGSGSTRYSHTTCYIYVKWKGGGMDGEYP
ncbi:hypothetical protein YC2023_123061 [Brassica napus]